MTKFLKRVRFERTPVPAMPFSLADCFLNPSDPERKRKEPRPSGPAEPPRAGPTDPAGEGLPAPAAASSSPPPPPGPTAPAKRSSPRGTPDPTEAALRELKSLLGEFSSEWKQMVGEVEGLKKSMNEARTLEPAAPAMRAGNSASTPSPPSVAATLPQAAPQAAVAAQAPLSSQRAATPRPTATAPPSPPGAPVSRPAAASEPATAKSMEIQPELNAKLGELLALLKENAAAKASGLRPTLEVPKHLTAEIAREVAGKVKESVLASLRDTPRTESSASQEPRSTPPVEAPKRIPLDDVGALIDQLTRPK